MDATTYALRIGCGTLFGAVLGLIIVCYAADFGVMEVFSGDHGIARAIIAVVALVFAALATRYGDRAYDFVLRYLRDGRR